jgi:DNA-binding NarL/FixJ family response regulator
MKRVLIIDDSEVIRDRIKALLAETGQVGVIETADGARQGLALLQSMAQDVVILDLRLPDGSGLAVLQEIKTKYPATRVAILTNYPYAVYRRRCTELGADFFFDKSREFEKVKSLFEALGTQRKCDEVHISTVDSSR